MAPSSEMAVRGMAALLVWVFVVVFGESVFVDWDIDAIGLVDKHLVG